MSGYTQWQKRQVIEQNRKSNFKEWMKQKGEYFNRHTKVEVPFCIKAIGLKFSGMNF